MLWDAVRSYKLTRVHFLELVVVVSYQSRATWSDSWHCKYSNHAVVVVISSEMEV